MTEAIALTDLKSDWDQRAAAVRAKVAPMIVTLAERLAEVSPLSREEIESKVRAELDDALSELDWPGDEAIVALDRASGGS
jgi:hypothetical protein